jgi:hypothetical protein
MGNEPLLQLVEAAVIGLPFPDRRHAHLRRLYPSGFCGSFLGIARARPLRKLYCSAKVRMSERRVPLDLEPAAQVPLHVLHLSLLLLDERHFMVGMPAVCKLVAHDA